MARGGNSRMAAESSTGGSGEGVLLKDTKPSRVSEAFRCCSVPSLHTLAIRGYVQPGRARAVPLGYIVGSTDTSSGDDSMNRLCGGLLIALALSLACGCDSKPTVTVICPWAAGGGTDQVAQFWAEALEKELGRRVVVSNKTGGSGATGHSAGAKARPDGNTITMITFELCTMKPMGLDAPTREDFRPLMQVNADPAAIVVRKDAPWKSLSELLDHIKAHPEEVVMSGTATGGAWDLARVGLLEAAGVPINAVIWVPNTGAAPSLTDLLGGHVHVVCCSVPEAANQIETGQLRALAVMSPERLAKYPNVPTVKEQGINWQAVGWRGLAVPKGTPDDIAAQLTDACQKIAKSQAYRKYMDDRGFEIQLRGPEEFAAFLAEQDGQWKPVIEAAGYAKQP
jgi:tripartite-type tricarboxylate transporter receptor subunit TctC